ncbi:MAG: hypothetical protein ACI361_08295 [Atopobiaceae bacterium]
MGAGFAIIVLGVIIAIWQSTKRKNADGKVETKPEDEAWLSQQARKMVDEYHEEKKAEEAEAAAADEEDED